MKPAIVLSGMCLSFVLFGQHGNCNIPSAGNTFVIPIEDSLAIRKVVPAAAHFSLTALNEQFVELMLKQLQGEASVMVCGPDGLTVLEGEIKIRDKTRISFVASASGVYLLYLKALSSTTVTEVSVQRSELRAATFDDPKRVKADAETRAADRLRDGTVADLRQAARLYTNAASLLQEVNDKRQQTWVLRRLALLFRELGQTQDALRALEAERSILGESMDQYQDRVASFNLSGMIVNNLGDSRSALKFFEEGLSLNRRANDAKGIGRSLNGIGAVYSTLPGKERDAIKYYDAAAVVMRDAGDRNLYAVVISNTGLMLVKLQDMEGAISTFKKAIEIVAETKNVYLQRSFSANLARVFAKTGQRREALSLFESIAIGRDLSGDNNGVAAAYTEMGDISFEDGAFQQAVGFYLKALDKLKSTEEPNYLADALLGLSRVYKKLGKLEEAKASIEQNFRLSEAYRYSLGHNSFRQSASAWRHQDYELFVEILMELHQAHPSKGYDALAFKVSESSRGRTLLDSLVDVKVPDKISSNAGLVVVERLQQSRATLSQALLKSWRVRHEGSRPREVAVADQSYENAQLAYRALQSELARIDPAYAALVHPNGLTVSETQKRVVDRDTVLVEYSLGQDKSFVWAITTEGVSSAELPGRAVIERLVRRFRDSVGARGCTPVHETDEQAKRRISTADQQLPDLAKALGRILLDPIRSSLNRHRIAFVADGLLQALPFAAIGSPKREYSRSLIGDHEIVVLPSATVLAEMRVRREASEPARKGIAIFANPVFDSKDSRLKDLRVARDEPAEVGQMDEVLRERLYKARGGACSSSSTPSGFEALPGSEREAEAIAGMVEGSDVKKAFGFDSNLHTVLDSSIGGFKYLHFATHGFSPVGDPENTGLVLSLVNRQGQSQPGLLTLSQLFGLRLNADLVTLSACETGLGKDVQGEGLVGIARGFMYAGVPRVTASLWRIDDSPTAALMIKMYSLVLNHNRPPSTALREAQLSIRANPAWAHPYYWAGFSLSGEWK